MSAAIENPQLGKFSAVFFDLGGTLFHPLPANHTEDNLCAVMQNPNGRDALMDIYNRHRRQVEDESLYQAFFMHRSLVAEALQRTLDDLGLQDQSAAHRFCDAQRDSVTNLLKLRAETIPTLTALRGLGLYTAIVSNIDDDYIVPLLKRSGLARHFQHWLSSERARSCKPHGGIFRQALEKAGIAPERVLFVGDSHHHDVVGARRAGMATALLTTDLAHHGPMEADYQLASLSDLLPLFR